jgi:hypothetical protein
LGVWPASGTQWAKLPASFSEPADARDRPRYLRSRLIPSQNALTSSSSGCQQSTHKGRCSSSRPATWPQPTTGTLGRLTAAAAGLHVFPGRVLVAHG